MIFAHLFLLLMISITTNAQVPLDPHFKGTNECSTFSKEENSEGKEGKNHSPLGDTEGSLVRISEIEVYPEYLKEYLEFAHNVGATSVKVEPGVICIYPMQQLRNNCQIRILEIYAS